MRVDATALVFGGSGFIGRWLVVELLRQGMSVIVPVRSAGSGERLTRWLDEHDARLDRLRIVALDRTQRTFGLVETARAATEVYNVAGAYAFGMSMEEARAANVEFAERVVEFSARLPALQRLVHLSGYRVGGQDPASVPWPDGYRRKRYSRLGAYEASKAEGDAVVRASADSLRVPLTIANPSSVIGHSLTGESDLQPGLATMLRDLRHGRLAALPGSPDIWVPVVAVDHLASMLALMPAAPETAGQDYWILDDDTPRLHELISIVAAHWGVRAPRLRLPLGLIRALPASLTRADPETLGFLSADRYPTASAITLAERYGLPDADTIETILRWADALAATGFGEAAVSGGRASRV